MADDKLPINTETRLGLLKSRLQIAKTWAKKPHDEWKRWIAEYGIEDYDTAVGLGLQTEIIRDKVRIGYIFRRAESDLPAIFDDQPELFFKGKGKVIQLDPEVENTYDWLWDTQRLEEKIEDVGLYFVLLGMGFLESPWVTETKKVPDVQQQPVVDPTTGQPLIDLATGQPAVQEIPVEYEVPIKDQPDASGIDPFKIFFSPETKFNTVLDYKHCPYYIKEHTLTPEEIESRFGKKVEGSTEVLSVDDDTETNQELSKLKDYKDDMKRVTVYEYYGVLPKQHALKGQNVEPWKYNKDYHVWFTNKEELQVEESKYTVKPCLVLGNYGLANKFWKFGDAKHLMPLVQELEQYRTQILKHTRKMANPKPLIPDDADVDEDAFRDPNVGRIVKYKPSATGAKPEYLSPAQLGNEVGTGVELVRTDLEQTSGSFNLAQGSGVSTVKTPRGIATFSEAADRNVKRKRKKIARFIRELLIFQFKECATNWKPNDDGTYDPRVVDIITGGQADDVVQGSQVVAAVLELLGDDNMLAKLDIEVESLSINRVQIKQDALELFDLAAQHPEIFNLFEMAKDLLQNGYNKKDADRYLVSMEQIKAQAIQEFIAQIGQQNPQLGGALAQMIQSPNMVAMQATQQDAKKTNLPEKETEANGLGELPAVG